MDLRFSLIGLIIGFLIGLTGMGGGSLMTPMMILIMGVKPAVAVGTDLAYSAITKIAGASMHARHGNVHRRTAYLLGVGSVPATIIGAATTNAVKRAHPALVNGFLVHAIACVLIIVAVVLALKPLITERLRRRGMAANGEWRDDIRSLGEQHPWILPIIGAVVGFLVGLTSVGSGTLIVMSLILLYPRWDSKELVATDVFQAAILVSAAGMAQLWSGNVNIGIAFSLLLGSLPGVLIGSRMAGSLPDVMLRLSMASVMLISGAKLL